MTQKSLIEDSASTAKFNDQSSTADFKSIKEEEQAEEKENRIRTLNKNISTVL